MESEDRLSFWPAFVGIVIFAVYLFLTDLPGDLSFFLIFYAIHFLGVFAILWLSLVVGNIWKGYWRTAVSVAAIPFIIWALRGPINFGCDYTHLLMTKNTYEREIASLPEPQGRRFATFDWSVGFIGTNTFLLYDESDQIALPAGKHTKTSNDDGFGPECVGNVTHLSGHYYVCRF